MLTDQLREEAASAHQQLEKRLTKRIRAVEDAQGYERILRMLFGYVHALEGRIEKVIDPEKLQDYEQRRKSSLILEDLAVFSTLPPHLTPVHVDLPEINDHFQAMGAVYVLESLALGGKINSKIIRDKLGLKTKKGTSFFRGYAEETWQKWEAFNRSINVLPRNSPEAKEVEKAAIETFDKFTRWADEYEQQNPS